MELLKREFINIQGGSIPIELYRYTEPEEEYYIILVDGVEWLDTDSRTHAAVLFQMMQEHVTEYMNYVRK